MNERRADVGAFLKAVYDGFMASAMDQDTRRCVDDVFATLNASVGTPHSAPRRFPACAALPAALKAAEASGGAYARAASSFAALDPLLSWSQRNGGPEASPNIMDGHANATVVGPGGLEHRQDAWVGISLLAPHVRYPNHRHDPEEIYLVLSPGEFRHGDSDWFTPGIGGTFYNEPSIQHAMRSGDAPLLAVWCLRPRN